MSTVGAAPNQKHISAQNRFRPLTAEAIARLADRGKDVSRFFSNSGKMLKPIQRVNVDFTASMLEELENAAKELNISRQAVIKTLIRQAPRPAPPRPLFPPPLVPSAPRSFCVSWRVAAP